MCAQVILVAAPSLPSAWVHPAFFAYSVVGAFTARVTFEDAMLADCIEYDQLFSGKRREGQYQVRQPPTTALANVRRVGRAGSGVVDVSALSVLT